MEQVREQQPRCPNVFGPWMARVEDSENVAARWVDYRLSVPAKAGAEEAKDRMLPIQTERTAWRFV